MNCLVTGASGFIGTSLVELLLSQGHSVDYLARRQTKQLDGKADFHHWETDEKPALRDMPPFDAVIHLAGEPVAQRWNGEVKRKIVDSRVDGTRNLVLALAESSKRPSVLVSASAIGYYGGRGDEWLTEQSGPGHGFLAGVCVAWEREAVQAREYGIRVVPIRIATVLGTNGGALPKMVAPFRLGLGGKFGNGRQWISWIHVTDLVRLIGFTLENKEMTDAVNGSSPNPVTNLEFSRTLSRKLHRPSLFSVPRFALKFGLGEMGDVLLESQRVSPDAAVKHGFRFKFPQLSDALTDLL